MTIDRAKLFVIAMLVALSPGIDWAADRVASAGDAYITRDEGARTWTIGNALVTATIQIENDRELRLLQFANATSGHRWEAGAGPDAVVSVDGRESAIGAPEAGYHLVNVIPRSDDTAVQLTVLYELREAHLQVGRHYVVYADTPALEAWTEFVTSDS